MVVLGCQAATAGQLLEELHASRVRPVSLELLNEAAIRALNSQAGGVLPDCPRVVLVGFEEKRETVGWQVQQLVKELPAGRVLSLDARLGVTSDRLWHGLAELQAWPEAQLTFKANLLPRVTAEFFQMAANFPDVLLQAHAGTGIIIGHAGAALTLDRARTMLASLQQAASAAQGNVVLLRAPPAWKATLPVWGTARGDAWLMRAVKEKLDPGNLFNPGRFI